jgi:adenylate cyclase
MNRSVEIERRFLVLDTYSFWSSDQVRIVQGYILRRSGRKFRVRIMGDQAILTCKRWMAPGVRQERNWPISLVKALDLMRNHCNGGSVEKIRYSVLFAERLWEVDVFTGRNEGLVIAEVELSHLNETVLLPSWVGPEITGNSQFGNWALAQPAVHRRRLARVA